LNIATGAPHFKVTTFYPIGSGDNFAFTPTFGQIAAAPGPGLNTQQRSTGDLGTVEQSLRLGNASSLVADVTRCRSRRPQRSRVLGLICSSAAQKMSRERIVQVIAM